MCPVASYNNMAQLCVRDWDPVPIHPESRERPLGGPKMGHGISRLNKEPMAHLWRTDPEACRGILQF
jgi:hypothetical protein